MTIFCYNSNIELFLELRVGFLEKAVGFYGKSRMRALADQTGVVEYLNFKVEPSAVKGGEGAFADDARAEGRGRQVVDVDVRADRGDPLAEQLLHAFGTAALDQRDHRGCRENSQRTAAHRDSGIFHGYGNGFFTGDPGFDFVHKKHLVKEYRGEK